MLVDKRLIRAALRIVVAVAIAGLLGACTQTDRLAARDRVSPFFGRSDAGTGGGGIPLRRLTDKDGTVLKDTAGNPVQQLGVKDLRVEQIQPVDLDTMKFPGQDKPAYQLAAADAAERNRLQDYLQTVSDQVCLGHKSDLLAMASTTNFALSGLTTLFGGVGAIVNGATAARTLGGTAAIANSLRGDFNENIMFNNFATAIVHQVDAQRQKQLQEIEPKRSRSIQDYSVDAAVRDIAEYHNLCSFSEGLAALATGDKRPSTADELRGRLEQLRDQLSKNNVLISDKATTPDQQKILVTTNQSILQMIQSVTLQLGLVSGAPAPSVPATTATH